MGNKAFNYKAFFNQYKNQVYMIAGIIVLFCFLLSKIFPSTMNIIQISKNYTTAQTTLKDKQREVEEIKARIEKAKHESELDEIKPFFKPIDKGMDTEAVIANEFTEILTIVRANSIKARSIKYTYDPEDDNFVKGAKESFNVAKLDMDMIATYKNFESFLKELYKHEHFLDISSMEITPYQKNKRILLIKFQMKLYAKNN